MINIKYASERQYRDIGWLKAHWLFSFNEYYDPENLAFGPLQVFNDDVIEPNNGFAPHQHNDMEIITILLDGELKHEDSEGNKNIIKKGEIQVMSAGTGLKHSEFNSGNVQSRLLQIWIMPDTPGLSPTCSKKYFDYKQYTNKMLPVADYEGKNGSLKINTDSTIYRSVQKKGNKIRQIMRPGRRGFIYLLAGNLQVNNFNLKEFDQARIESEVELNLTAETECEFIFIDMPY